MGFFERLRAASTKRSEEERVKHEQAVGEAREALRGLDDAERCARYSQARVTELLPYIREQAGLEIKEQLARQKLATARSGAKMLQTTRSPLAVELAKRMGDDVNQLPQLEADHAEAVRRLEEATRTREARDKELRKRFGLADAQH